MLALLLWAANAVSRASIADIKSLFAWVAAFGGLSLATLLLLSGRGAMAFSGVALLGPLAWRWWQGQPGRPGNVRSQPKQKMSREEALAVLGLTDPVSDADVREAWLRLMKVLHPDSGGTDYLASCANRAKDVLLSKR